MMWQIDDDLAVYWINTWSQGLLVRQKEDPISAQGMLNVDSYFGHSFLVIEEKARAHCGCLDCTAVTSFIARFWAQYGGTSRHVWLPERLRKGLPAFFLLSNFLYDCSSQKGFAVKHSSPQDGPILSKYGV